jgi:hypothetical protein
MGQPAVLAIIFIFLLSMDFTFEVIGAIKSFLNLPNFLSISPFVGTFPS